MTRWSGRSLRDVSLDRIDLVVSFVMRSGIELIAGRVDNALAGRAHVRLLTTDYLLVTDVGALGFFLDRVAAAPGLLEAKVFRDSTVSVHPKAYIFSSSCDEHGVAFVGRSKLSRSGLFRGVEWNIGTRAVVGR